MAPVRILLKFFYHDDCPGCLCFNKSQPPQLKYYSYLAERFVTPQAITVYPELELIHVYVERGIHPMDSVFWHHVEKTLVELMQEETNNGQLEPRRLYLKKRNNSHYSHLPPISFRLVGMELVVDGVNSLGDFVREQQRMFLNTLYFYSPFEPPRCELRIVYLDADYETDLKLMPVEPHSFALHEKVLKAIEDLCGTGGKQPMYDVALTTATRSLLEDIPSYIGAFEFFLKPLLQNYPQFVIVPISEDTEEEDKDRELVKLLIPQNAKKQQVSSSDRHQELTTSSTPSRILEFGLLKEGAFTTIKNSPEPAAFDEEEDNLLNVLRREEGRERRLDSRTEFVISAEQESELKDFFNRPIQASGDEDFLVILTKTPDEEELILEIFQNVSSSSHNDDDATSGFKKMELLRKSCAPLFER